MTDDLPFYDFMVDTETTGTDPSRHAMIQLGAVAFDWERGRVSPCTFEANLEMPPWRHWDEDTRNWWARQDPAAFEAATRNPQPPGLVMRAFAQWVRDVCGGLYKPRLWAKPISFELPLLSSYFRDFEVDNPFHFRDAIDLQSFIRGMRNNPAAAAFDKEVPMEGTAHTARDDAFHQIRVALVAKAKFATPSSQGEPNGHPRQEAAGEHHAGAEGRQGAERAEADGPEGG